MTTLVSVRSVLAGHSAIIQEAIQESTTLDDLDLPEWGIWNVATRLGLGDLPASEVHGWKTVGDIVRAVEVREGSHADPS